MIATCIRVQVSNVGTTSLMNISIVDASLAGVVFCPSDTLSPGQVMSCVSSEPSPVTTKDYTSGNIVNIASVVRASLYQLYGKL
ncbi:unnamed protein product [Hapterophycus canaliculatus]